MQDLHSTIYLPRVEARSPPVRRSRSQAEPLALRAAGPIAPSTLTPVRACQPSGIQVSTVVSLSATYFVKEISLTGTTDLYIIILLWCAKNGTASM